MLGQNIKDNIPQPPPPASAPTVEEEIDQLVAKNCPIGKRLLYVTTLDGRLTALDITKGGKMRWSIAIGPGSLISSNIHRPESTNNEQFVRMIPSLSGGIYKFDGESIDPVPITTDNLLSSSAKFSDDLVISGGKDTRSYGVSARTGQILYECSMHGCVNATDNELNLNATKTVEDNEKDDINNNDGYMREHDPLIDDVIVVRRQTQTVRASETRTGAERWNFSVGQHELNIIRPAKCHERFSNMDLAILDLDIKVIVPEGVICAFNKLEPTAMLWKYKFDHPIVSAWKIGSAGTLESIDIFGSAQWLWNCEDNALPTINPSIYVGMHDRQLYIQESVNLRKEILDKSNLYTQLTSKTRLPKVPWRPIAAKEQQRIVGEGSINSNEIKGNDGKKIALLAESVLNASENVNGNGFYLYTSDELENANDKSDLQRFKATSNSEENFTSRFQNDFDLVRCLGYGGFGVVFETKNKLDNCSYAIKRITLPNKEESRKRVMREVKTLANCDHQNIVRYFQSWETCTTSPSVPINSGNKKKNVQSCSSDPNCNDDIDEEEDSCVIFRSESDEKGNEAKSSQSNRIREINNEKRRLKDLDLDISYGENNNVNNRPPKPEQNKVYLYIQMQLCRKECLRDWLRDKKREDRSDYIASIFNQIVDALNYVHNKGHIHRDLKPSNIFFSHDGQIKIGDFGLVTDMADIPNMVTKCGDKTGMPSCARHTQHVGTHLYMSPEQLQGLPYDFKVDIYSLGLILFELLVYFTTEMERIMTLRSLREGFYPRDFPDQHPLEYNLLKKMLSPNPQERPPTNELKDMFFLKHVYQNCQKFFQNLFL